MFKDKLVILTYKNTIYQSKLKFCINFSLQTTYAISNRFRACVDHHTEAELS